MRKLPIIFLYEDSGHSDVLEPSPQLCEHDQRRVLKITSDKKRTEFLKSRSILNSILTQYFKLSPKLFKKRDNGQPYMDGNNLSISLSHSQNFFAYGFSGPETEVGIDVEAKELSSAVLERTLMYFSEQEVTALKSVSSQRTVQKKLFRQLWTLKESYYKVNNGSSALKETLNLNFNLKESSISFTKAPLLTKRPQFFTFSGGKVGLSTCIMGSGIDSIKCLENKSSALTSFKESDKAFTKLYVKE